jgi:hypothetical protein
MQILINNFIAGVFYQVMPSEQVVLKIISMGLCLKSAPHSLGILVPRKHSEIFPCVCKGHLNDTKYSSWKGGGFFPSSKENKKDLIPLK